MHRSARASALAVLLMIAGCGTGPPTKPVPGVTAVYVQGKTVIIPGETSDFRAIQMQSGSGTADVTDSARWSVANVGVAIVDRGRVRRVAPGSSVVSARTTVVGQAAVVVVTPHTSAPDAQGRAIGNMTISDCTRVSGDGPNLCRDLVGARFAFDLNITGQSGPQLSGTLRLFSQTVGMVTGYVDSAGDLQLTGTLAVDGDPMAYMIRRMRLTRSGMTLKVMAEVNYALPGGLGGPQFVRQTFLVEATYQ